MMENITFENMDFEKINECSKKFRKLRNIMIDIFSEKSNVVYAFGRNENEILKELSKYGLNKTNMVSIGYGGYIHKDNLEQFKNLNKYIKDIKKEFVKKNNYNACGLYLNRLWDYESRYAWDYSDAINDLKYYLDIENLNELDKELLKMLKMTERYYEMEFDRIN